ncbi:MAG TPA: hypothetical protein VNS34_06155 [Rhizobiaceae bacterium]|nr:hypothetical protein [Rhizobiaceae bacterium]
MQYEPGRVGAIAGHSWPVSGVFPGWRAYFTVVACFAFLVLSASLLQDLLLLGGTISKASKIWLLDIDVEQSAFTWISVLAFFFAAQLLFQLGQAAIARNSRFKWHWLFLAGLFLLLSFDEFSGVHEKISAGLASQFDNTGLFYFAWAAPAGLLALLGLAAFIPFIRSFPPRLAVLLMLSAAIFLFGAVGMEMVGGAIAEARGLDTLSYRLATTVEEGAELSGVLLFVYVLLTYRETLPATDS